MSQNTEQTPVTWLERYALRATAAMQAGHWSDAEKYLECLAAEIERKQGLVASKLGFAPTRRRLAR